MINSEGQMNGRERLVRNKTRDTPNFQLSISYFPGVHGENIVESLPQEFAVNLPKHMGDESRQGPQHEVKVLGLRNFRPELQRR